MVGIIARNYARALSGLMLETRPADLEAVGADLALARDALADKDTVAFLASKLIGKAAKKALVTSAFSGRVDPMVLTMLSLLLDRDRIKALADIAEEYENLARHARGKREAVLWSASPLDENSRLAVARALEKRLGGQVELESKENPALIGGITAESEGQEIRFSVEGQLEALSRKLAGKR